MSKIFENDLKTRPNRSCMGICAKFSKFAGEEKRQNRDVIICLIISALKSSQTSSLPVTNSQWQNLFDKLNLVTQTVRPLQK